MAFFHAFPSFFKVFRCFLKVFGGFSSVFGAVPVPNLRLELLLSDPEGADLRLWTLRLHREGLGTSKLAAELARWDVAYAPRLKLGA